MKPHQITLDTNGAKGRQYSTKNRLKKQRPIEIPWNLRNPINAVILVWIMISTVALAITIP